MPTIVFAGQAKLIASVVQYLSDLTVVYSVHDTVTALLSWDHREELLELIEEGECESDARCLSIVPTKTQGSARTMRSTRLYEAIRPLALPLQDSAPSNNTAAPSPQSLPPPSTTRPSSRTTPHSLTFATIPN